MSNEISRRKFIKTVYLVAPIFIFGINACNQKIDLNNIKDLNFPNLFIENNDYLLDAWLKKIHYTGKENTETLLKTILNQMQKDFAAGNCIFANGWLLSETEIVLSNLSLHD